MRNILTTAEWTLSSWVGARRPRRQRAEEARNRVLLLWWGSFAKGGGGTIGDLHAIRNLADHLESRGLQYDIACARPLPFSGYSAVPLSKALPANYAAAAFVCGPLDLGRGRLRRLIRRYRSIPRAALGVSIVGSREHAERWFSAIVARDGPEEVRFDLSIAHGHLVPPIEKPPFTAAICLRGRQLEYGADVDLSGRANAAVVGTADRIFGRYIVLDTVLGPTNSSDSIEEQFRDASFLITTRLHGCLFALLHRVPFIAVDQIHGGAKISRLMRRIGWKNLLNADDEALAEKLASMAAALSSHPWTSEMEAVRSVAIQLSQETVAECGAALLSLIQEARR